VSFRSHCTTWIPVQCNREFIIARPAGEGRNVARNSLLFRPSPDPTPGLASLRSSWTPPNLGEIARGAAGTAGGSHFAPGGAISPRFGAPPASATIPRPFHSLEREITPGYSTAPQTGTQRPSTHG
jgi:hypothetical protein